MATIQLGGGIASIRGSIGGWTFSRNRGGDYTRNRVIPVQPGSAQQNAVKALMAQLTNIWATTLTAAQRAAWDAYAEAVELPNSQGIYRNVGGLGMFVRGNLPRLQNSLTETPRVDDGPTTWTLGDFTAPSIGNASEASQNFSVAFVNTDDWASEDEAAMFVYCSRPTNPGVNFFKGPYRFVDAILGNSTTPPTSPATMAAPFPFVQGQKLFFRVTVTRADGRLSTSFRDDTTCIA